MSDTIVRKSITGADAVVGSVVNQDLSGIVIAMNRAPQSGDYVTIEHRPVKGEGEILANRISLLAFAGISDSLFGSSNGLQAALNALTTTDFVSYAIAIPLGAIRQTANPGTVEISVEIAATAKVSVSSYWNSNEKDHAFRWMESKLLQGTQDGCVTAWLYNSTDTVDPSSLTLSATVRASGRTELMNEQDIFAYTQVFGEFEAESPRNVVSLWHSPNEGMEDGISWNLTGASAASFSVITCSVIRDAQRVVAGEVKQAATVREIVNRRPLAARQGMAHTFQMPGGVEV